MSRKTQRQLSTDDTPSLTPPPRHILSCSLFLIRIQCTSCIVISGLASHPFGSWQEKKTEKSYMWIRDSLPVHLPNMRAILYGYDSRLVKSRSFQSIGEIAGTFRDRLLPMKCSTSNPRLLVFLAHSLGGIILKKALVMLADSGPGGSRLLDRVLGGSMSFRSDLVFLSRAC